MIFDYVGFIAVKEKKVQGRGCEWRWQDWWTDRWGEELQQDRAQRISQWGRPRLIPENTRARLCTLPTTKCFKSYVHSHESNIKPMSVSTFKVVLCTAGLSKQSLPLRNCQSHMEGFWNKRTKWQSSNNNTILNPSPFFLPLQSNSKKFLGSYTIFLLQPLWSGFHFLLLTSMALPQEASDLEDHEEKP